MSVPLSNPKEAMYEGADNVKVTSVPEINELMETAVER